MRPVRNDSPPSAPRESLPSGMRTSIFIYLSWTTGNRAPLIGEFEAGRLRTQLFSGVKEQAARALAVTILQNDVQLLVEVPARFDLSKLVAHLKAASATHAIRWGDTFTARSISPGRLSNVIALMQRYEEHHPDLAVAHFEG